MFKIPLRLASIADFPDHGIRFGCVQGFYVTMDGTNAVYEAVSDTDSTDDYDSIYQMLRRYMSSDEIRRACEYETSEYETSEYETTGESESDCCCFINFRT